MNNMIILFLFKANLIEHQFSNTLVLEPISKPHRYQMTTIKKLIILISFLATVYAGNGPFFDQINKIKESILDESELNYRLPNSTHPETYDLSLWTRVDAEDFEFRGLVKIAIVVDEPTRDILLHQRQLVIVNITLSKLSGSDQLNVPILPYTYENVREFLNITTNGTDLNVGDRLILEINYIGSLRDRLEGFFKTSYTNGHGRKVYGLFSLGSDHIFSYC